MPNVKRKIILGISDPHCGYELGLTNPETELRNKGRPELNESQDFLWNDVYLPGMRQTIDLAGRDDIHAFFLGDITHGIRFPTGQISTRMSDQISYACYSLLPLLKIKNVKSLDMAIGTSSHVFGEGSAEILVADLLHEKVPNKPVSVSYHGLKEFGEFSIDYAHHGPSPGNRNWLRGNIARLYLRSMMMDDLDSGSAPANLVMRGHYHSFVKEWCCITRMGVDYESWIVIMPPMCFPSDYTHQATRSGYRINVGLVAFEVINGRLHQTYPFIQSLDSRRIERSE